MKQLVKCHLVGSHGFEQPFGNNTYLEMHHGDLLKIGDRTFQAKGVIATITRTDDDDDASCHHSDSILLVVPNEVSIAHSSPYLF
jgi:hypothetical protein